MDNVTEALLTDLGMSDAAIAEITTLYLVTTVVPTCGTTVRVALRGLETSINFTSHTRRIAPTHDTVWRADHKALNWEQTLSNLQKRIITHARNRAFRYDQNPVLADM